MNTLDLDPSFATVVDCVREHNERIEQALTNGRKVTDFDCAVLSGAVSALLDAIDARLPQHEERPAIKAVAA